VLSNAAQFPMANSIKTLVIVMSFILIVCNECQKGQ
jgi:hypothetical protein